MHFSLKAISDLVIINSSQRFFFFFFFFLTSIVLFHINIIYQANDNTFKILHDISTLSGKSGHHFNQVEIWFNKEVHIEDSSK